MVILFKILVFITPLLFYKGTSELFEFNKIVFVYLSTTAITLLWLYKSVVSKKIIFSRTVLDGPIILYLSILLISALFSIDPRTSIFGYYSRFNGGLLSQLCYSLLYWAFVSNINKKESLDIFKYLVYSVTIVSVLAILEHYGVFVTCGLMGSNYLETCWVQDVQTRVFSTLGQPNWLAALVVSLIPILWSFIIIKENGLKLAYLAFSAIFFITLIFTKSRSGVLAFGISSVSFLLLSFYFSKIKSLKPLLLIVPVFILTFFLSKVEFNNKDQSQETIQSGTSIETGGTESGTIRKYVWMGAINVFKNNPIIGTGPETFAYVFPKYKPNEHNQTSEWDFIYNKAHNELLNTLATTGILGLTSYLLIIFLVTFEYFKKVKTLDSSSKVVGLGMLVGYLSIHVTNFFGFSVVTTSLLLSLLPASIMILDKKDSKEQDSASQKNNTLIITLFLLAGSFIFLNIYKYWSADLSYNKAKSYNLSNNHDLAQKEIEKSLSISPNEATYVAEAALTYSELAISSINQNNEEEAFNYADKTLNSLMFLDLNSRYNINNRRLTSGIYYKFAVFDQNYLQLSENVLEESLEIAPNDPKLYYQLAIIKLKNNKIEEALRNFEKSVELKPNYKEAYFAKGLTLIDVKRYTEAIATFQYLLDKIDPNDELTKKYLQEAAMNLK